MNGFYTKSSEIEFEIIDINNKCIKNLNFKKLGDFLAFYIFITFLIQFTYKYNIKSLKGGKMNEK